MASEKIDASPTKEFFIDMLVRDIDLDRAILDLIDNSVDAWVENRSDDNKFIKINFDSNQFIIHDNCGGMDFELAKTYAFRFGRPKERATTPNSVGQFGVGMKRTLFKLGKSFKIVSRKDDKCFQVSVDVNNWKSSDTWNFDIEVTAFFKTVVA
ncbi:ATP-binding protein [Shewanella frigidimarina]|uniref:ATP-binding protein n=1 Tax=Shewanella frigidimarina TaxID=56812 RepID=UPI003D7ADB57